MRLTVLLVWAALTPDAPVDVPRAWLTTAEGEDFELAVAGYCEESGSDFMCIDNAAGFTGPEPPFVTGSPGARLSVRFDREVREVSVLLKGGGPGSFRSSRLCTSSHFPPRPASTSCSSAPGGVSGAAVVGRSARGSSRLDDGLTGENA